ncbi:MAG: putative GNAT family N-acyltransferase [Flammeovirgaceae bacterium]|jgi:predicted GNAT family N-acyltransferase
MPKEKKKIRVCKIEVEQTWELRQRVMWPNEPIEYVKLPEDTNGIHFGLFVGKKLVSVVSVFIDGNSAQFRKFATDISKQGKGYGSKLLNHLFVAIQPEKFDRIWCNARIEKADFYEQFGMKKTNQVFIKRGIEFVVMERVLGK